MNKKNAAPSKSSTRKKSQTNNTPTNTALKGLVRLYLAKPPIYSYHTLDGIIRCVKPAGFTALQVQKVVNEMVLTKELVLENRIPFGKLTVAVFVAGRH